MYALLGWRNNTVHENDRTTGLGSFWKVLQSEFFTEWVNDSKATGWADGMTSLVSAKATGWADGMTSLLSVRFRENLDPLTPKSPPLPHDTTSQPPWCPLESQSAFGDATPLDSKLFLGLHNSTVGRARQLSPFSFYQLIKWGVKSLVQSPAVSQFYFC